MKKGTLKFIRNNEWAYRHAKINIKANGKSLGTISRNEIKEFEIDPGEYNIQINQQFMKSRSVMVPIAEGQIVTFQIKINDGETFGKNFMSLLTGIGMPKPELERIRS
nr:hypothetical protein [uncultured Desulfobacter sp.]